MYCIEKNYAISNFPLFLLVITEREINVKRFSLFTFFTWTNVAWTNLTITVVP